MSSTKTISVKALLIESTFIVIGVAIALGANEVREHFRDQDRAEQTLSVIASELCRNYGIVSSRVAYYIPIRDTLRAVVRAAPDARFEGAKFPQHRGARPLLFTSAGLDMALSSTVLTHIDPNLVGEIAIAYEIQAMAEMLQQRFLQASINGNLDTVSGNLSYFAESAAGSSEVKRLYEQLIPKLPNVPSDCLAAISPPSQPTP
ncbi:MAG: hypothetical protein AAF730_07935 [Bacteroidota bacterium]